MTCRLMSNSTRLQAIPRQVSPVVLGERHLPDPLQGGAQPLLFVGNHTRFGLYDLPLLVRPPLS